jgi:6-pyruvoyl-tetrahydropterin synthase
MSTIAVRCHFAAGHRILGLTGPGAKCASIHGHTFHVTWTYLQEASDFNLDFGVLKENLRSMVKQHFDHGFFVAYDDDLRHYLLENNQKHYVLDSKPTTEAIAAEIARRSEQLFPGARLVSVEVCEGPNNMATWTPPLVLSTPNGAEPAAYTEAPT